MVPSIWIWFSRPTALRDLKTRGDAILTWKDFRCVILMISSPAKLPPIGKRIGNHSLDLNRFGNIGCGSETSRKQGSCFREQWTSGLENLDSGPVADQFL